MGGISMELIYKVKKPETIKNFMTENNIPTSILQKDEKNYKIYVNNEENSRKRKDTVRKGDKIHFLLEDEGLNKNVKPEESPLEIIYEDDLLVIVNKPANTPMSVSKTNKSNTLANYLVAHYQKHSINNMIHFINHLDKEASGIVVVAKHRFVKFLLSNKLNNELDFSYKAIISGKMAVNDFDICLPIGKQPETKKRVVTENGEDCSTKYHVEKEFKNYSLLDINVKGKIPHQIRVHLAYFDHPILGDKLYNEKDTHENLMLYCYKTEFNNPVTENPIKVELPLPETFKEIMK